MFGGIDRKTRVSKNVTLWFQSGCDIARLVNIYVFCWGAKWQSECFSILFLFLFTFHFICAMPNDRVRFVWIAFEMSKHQNNLFSGSIDSTSNCGLPSCGPIWMVCCLMSNKLTERLGRTLSYQIMIDIVCYRLMVDEIFPYSIRQCSCGSCLVHGPS